MGCRQGNTPADPLKSIIYLDLSGYPSVEYARTDYRRFSLFCKGPIISGIKSPLQCIYFCLVQGGIQEFPHFTGPDRLDYMRIYPIHCYIALPSLLLLANTNQSV